MGTCASLFKSSSKKKKKPINMAIPVPNKLETTADVNGAVPDDVLSPSTKRISESPIIYENLATPPTKVKSRCSSKTSYGSSKEESFFDTRQWLPSDSEDDFYSTYGDFTPSRGNTPKSSLSERPRGLFVNSPAPPRRKKLGELFRDSIREDRHSSILEHPDETTQSSSGELNILDNDNTKKKKKKNKNLKAFEIHQRCLPRFPSFNGSLMVKKKKKNIHVK